MQQEVSRLGGDGAEAQGSGPVPVNSGQLLSSYQVEGVMYIGVINHSFTDSLGSYPLLPLMHH